MKRITKPALTVHIVRPGETLFSIGRWYGVNPYQIAHTNGLHNPNYIYIGQRLLIRLAPGNPSNIPKPALSMVNPSQGR
jgi:spore germination protein